MSKQKNIKQLSPLDDKGVQIERVINSCAVTIIFAPKTDSFISEIRRMMLSNIAKS